MVLTIVIIMVMSIATTIQISQDEDNLLMALKREMDAPTKKAVILQALQLLREQIQKEKRAHKLEALSKKLAKQSLEINQAWAPQSSTIKKI